MITSSDYLERKRKLASEILTLGEVPSENWTVEHQRSWEAANEKYDSAVAEYESHEQRARQAAERDETVQRLKEANRDLRRFEDRELLQSSTPQAMQDRTELRWAKTAQVWLRGTMRGVDSETREAMAFFGHDDMSEIEFRSRPCSWLPNAYKKQGRPYLDTGLKEKWETEDRLGEETRDWSTGKGGGTGGAGEFIPVGFQRELERALLQYGGIQNIARNWQTSGFNPIHWPLLSDVGNKAVILPEANDIGPSVDPNTNEIVFNAYKFSSKPVIVSAEMVEDSFTSIPALLADLLAERIGRGLADYFALGTGSNEPHGCLAAAPAATNNWTAAGLTYDDVVTSVHEIDPAYRGNFSWCFHDSTLLELRKVKDDVGRPLWQPSMETAEPDRIFGYPYQVDQAYNPFGASTDVATIGDHSKFVIRMHAAYRFYRLMELYRAKDQEGYIAFMRADSKLLDAGTNPVKKVATGA